MQIPMGTEIKVAMPNWVRVPTTAWRMPPPSARGLTLRIVDVKNSRLMTEMPFVMTVMRIHASGMIAAAAVR